MSIPITYIIVGYNSRQYLETCLGSVFADAPTGAEVLFIDNASHDDSCALIRQQFPDTRLMVNDSNIGHCRAVNQGFREARGDYFMLLDADTELEPGTTAHLLEFLHENPSAKVVAPRLLNPDGSVQETARRFPSAVNAFFGRQTFLARLFPNNPITARYLARENLLRNDPFQVDWVSAACMLLPRSTYENIGGVDEGFTGYWVDCDWCKTIQEAGGPIFCVPGARVWHYEQNRAGRRVSFYRIRVFNYGVYRYYRKHHTRGPWDPRAILVAGLLLGRAAVQVVVNRFLPTADPAADPPGRASSPAENENRIAAEKRAAS